MPISWEARRQHRSRPGDLPRLFERFPSGLADQGLPDHRRRYGIGLALVGEVAARHGGTVAAAASPGPGAGIRLTFRSYTGSSKKTPRTVKDPSSDATRRAQLPENFRGRGRVESRRSRWWLVS
jgi:hypothetical protein